MRAFLLIPLLALGACEAKTEHSKVSVSDKDGLDIDVNDGGRTASVSIGGAAGEATEKAGIDLAPVAAAYPGAREVKRETKTDDGKQKIETEYRTADAAAKVTAFYDERIKAAGAAPIVSAQANDTAARVVVARGGQQSFALGVEPKDGETRITIETTGIAR